MLAHGAAVNEKRWIARGRAFLETPPDPPGKQARDYVRIYYTSAGGELLCVTAGPLTWQAADALVYGTLRPARADFQRWSVSRCVCHARPEDHPLPPLKWGARLVTFPSQERPDV